MAKKDRGNKAGALRTRGRKNAPLPKNESPPPKQQPQNWGAVPPLNAFDNLQRLPPPAWQQEEEFFAKQAAQRQNSQQAKAKSQSQNGKNKKHTGGNAQNKQKKSGQKNARAKKRQANPAKRRKQRQAAAVFAALLFIVLGVWFSVTVLFKINKYEVQGEGIIYSSEEVVANFGHAIGDNLYGFSAKNAEERLVSALPYIEKATVRRRLPSTVVFKLTPAQEAYYLPYEGGFVVLNASGKVLKESPEPTQGLVRIDGLTSLVVSPGQPIKLNEDAIKAAQEAKKEAELLAKEGLSSTSLAGAASLQDLQSSTAQSESAQSQESQSETGQGQEDESTSLPQSLAQEPAPQEPEQSPQNAAESFDVMWILLDALKEFGIEEIDWLNVADPLQLSFSWQGRITVKLGPKGGMEEKMQAATVLLTGQEQGIAQEDRGTLDLSLYLSTGECIFTPE